MPKRYGHPRSPVAKKWWAIGRISSISNQLRNLGRNLNTLTDGDGNLLFETKEIDELFSMAHQLQNKYDRLSLATRLGK